jgi:hypothetical protein
MRVNISFDLNIAIEDYFNLLTEYMDRSPEGLISLSYLPTIFQCSLRCLETTSANALISVYLWYTDFAKLLIKKSISASNLSKIESIFIDPASGGTLIQSSLKGLLTTFPKEREVIDYVGSFFMEFHTISPNFFLEIINSIVEGFSEDFLMIKFPGPVKTLLKPRYQGNLIS